MKKCNIEFWVGFLIVFAVLGLSFLAIKVSGFNTYIASDNYTIIAKFQNIGDLKIKAPVSISGVNIGYVSSIKIDHQTFEAIVTMKINNKITTIPKDSSADIYTAGIIGSNYVNINPGFADTFLEHNDEIAHTNQALILQKLVDEIVGKMMLDK